MADSYREASQTCAGAPSTVPNIQLVTLLTTCVVMSGVRYRVKQWLVLWDAYVKSGPVWKKYKEEEDSGVRFRTMQSQI
jgi:hypothetical protein